MKQIISQLLILAMLFTMIPVSSAEGFGFPAEEDLIADASVEEAERLPEEEIPEPVDLNSGEWKERLRRGSEETEESYEKEPFVKSVDEGVSLLGSYDWGWCGDNVKWEFTGSTLTLSGTGYTYNYKEEWPGFAGYIDEITKIVVKSGVTGINGFIFYEMDKVASVSIASTVEYIGVSAFKGCTSLTSISIPGSVVTIDLAAFWECENLKSVTTAAGLQYIGEQAFNGCKKLASFSFPNTVKEIHGYAFQGCALTSVTLPKSLEYYGGRVFNECRKLTSISVVGGNAYFSSSDGILFDKDKTILVCYPAGKTGDAYTIPSSVIIVWDSAFYMNNELKSVTIPSSVEEIGEYAFNYCENLTRVYFEGDAPIIWEGGYDNSSFYSSAVTFYVYNSKSGWTDAEGYDSYNGTWYGYKLVVQRDPNEVASGYCGYSAGDNVCWVLTKDGTLTISGSGYMANYVLFETPWMDYADQITKIVVKDGVKDIGEFAFSGLYNVTSIAIPASVEDVCYAAFVGCDCLQSVTVDAGNLNYLSQDGVLFNKDKTELVWYPIGKTDTSYTIPDTVQTVWDFMFFESHHLQTIIIPASVEYIGDETFGGCTKLTAIVVDSGNPYFSAQDGVLFNEDKTQLVAYPTGKADASYTVPSTVTGIGLGAFHWCQKLTSITLPSGLVEISDGAFSGCQELTEITIPDTVEYIGWYAFQNCPKLTKVYFTGNSPELVVPGYAGDEEASFDSTKVTLYAYNGKFGWTDAEGYDSHNGTWYGYKLVMQNDPNVVAFGTCGDGVFWEIGKDGVLTIFGEGYVEFETDSGNSWETVLDYDDIPWYGYRDRITAVVVEKGIYGLCNFVFAGLNKAKTISLPASLWKLDDGVFMGCTSLTAIEVDGENPDFSAQDGVLFYDDTVLVWYPAGKTDTTYTVPSGVEQIGFPGRGPAFGESPYLTKIVVSADVRVICDSAFLKCGKLTAIEVDSGNPNFSAQDGVLFNKDKTELIAYPNGKTGTSYAVPSSVWRIRSGAFRGNDQLTAVCFEGSAPDVDLWEVDTGNGNAGSFDAERVTLYYIPGNSGWTDSDAYNAAAGTWNGYKLAVWIEQCDAKIGNTYYRSLGEAVAAAETGDTVTLLKNVDMGIMLITVSKVLTINRNGFSANGLMAGSGYKMETTAQNYIFKVDDRIAFGYCGGEGDGRNLRWELTKDGVLTIFGTGRMGEYNDIAHMTPWSLEEEKIKTVLIGDGVTTISDYVFYGCTNLTSVSVSASVCDIGSSAFDNCTGLTAITVADGNPCYCDQDSVLFNRQQTALLRYPEGKAEESYRVPEGVTRIGDGAFRNCTGLREVVIRNGVAVIEEYAFGSCSNLETVSIPDSVTHIDSFAFSLCYCLTEIVIPSGVTAIESFTFWCCESLTEVVIPDGVTEIGHCAFDDCCSLTEIVIPDSVTAIGDSAFFSCCSLKEVVIPANVTTIGAWAFYDCIDLTKVYFEGKAPAVAAADDDMIASFNGTVTLYYVAGMTGWTDSEAYNAAAGTWNGYKLAVWQDYRKVELTPGDDGKVEIYIRTDDPCRAVVAVYDANGRFVACKVRDLVRGVNRWTAEAGKSLKLLQVDGASWAPLYEPVEYLAK